MIVMIVPHIETMPCYATTTTTTGIKHAVCRAVLYGDTNKQQSRDNRDWIVDHKRIEFGIGFRSIRFRFAFDSYSTCNFRFNLVHCFALQ